MANPNDDKQTDQTRKPETKTDKLEDLPTRKDDEVKGGRLRNPVDINRAR